MEQKCCLLNILKTSIFLAHKGFGAAKQQKVETPRHRVEKEDKEEVEGDEEEGEGE